MANTYILLASNTLTSTTDTITFSSIPNTYTDLVLRTSIRNTTSGTYGGLLLRFNSDSGTNYSTTNLYADGTSAFSDQLGPSATYLNLVTQFTGTTASTFTSNEVYIPNYTSTSSKSVAITNVTENNSASANYVGVSAGFYLGTSAISTITITTGSTIAVGSSFFLYGIKNT